MESNDKKYSAVKDKQVNNDGNSKFGKLFKRNKSEKPKDGFMKVRQPSGKQIEKQAITRFDRVYKNLGDKLIPEAKRIDIVLIHTDPKQKDDLSLNAKERKKVETRERVREVFEKALQEEGFLIEKTILKDVVYKKLHCPFRRLCLEAETINLEMPLLGVNIMQSL